MITGARVDDGHERPRPGPVARVLLVALFVVGFTCCFVVALVVGIVRGFLTGLRRPRDASNSRVGSRPARAAALLARVKRPKWSSLPGGAMPGGWKSRPRRSQTTTRGRWRSSQ